MSKETHEKRYKIKSKRQRNKGPVGKAPQGNMWRTKSDYKDSEETKPPSINKVSKDNVENNSAINISGIHYEGNKDGDVKEYTDEDEDEDECDEEYSDDCGIIF